MIDVWLVFLYALATAVATGLGALPFLFVSTISSRVVALSNAVAAGLMLGASFFFVGFLGDQLPTVGTWQGEALAMFSFFDQMHRFSRGIVDTRPIVLFVSLTVFFLFVTLRMVESRRWK